MSQNSHSLVLFYDDTKKHQFSLLTFWKLKSNDKLAAKQYATKLGLTLSDEWIDNWANLSVDATPDYICINFDTSISESLPLNELEQLFNCGLTSAVIDTFNDQVGESTRHHFHQAKLVNQNFLYQANQRIAACIEKLLENADEESIVSVKKPITITELIKKEQQRLDDANEMIKTMLELGKASKESGTNPLELAKSVLLIRALIKGAVQAIIYLVVTILLFKGFWLWLVSGLLLLIILPLYHAGQVSKEFSDDEVEEPEEPEAAEKEIDDLEQEDNSNAGLDEEVIEEQTEKQSSTDPKTSTTE